MTADNIDPGRFKEALVDGIEPGHFLQCVVAQCRPIERDFSHLPSKTFCRLPCLTEFAGINEQLFGDATDVDTGAPQRARFNHRYPRTELGAFARCPNATRTCADYQ